MSEASLESDYIDFIKYTFEEEAAKFEWWTGITNQQAEKIHSN